MTDTPERTPLTTRAGAGIYRADGTLIYRDDPLPPDGDTIYLLAPNEPNLLQAIRLPADTEQATNLIQKIITAFPPELPPNCWSQVW